MGFEKQSYVYVLLCADETYYVGFTRWLHLRLQAHFLGAGATFTKEHKPTSLLFYRPAETERDEYDVWRKFADVFGFKRVGGYNKPLCGQFGFEWPYYNGKLN